MGNRRRILKNLQSGISMAKTGIVVDGCEVYVGGDVGRVGIVAKGFKKLFVSKMCQPNLYDMYECSFLVRERLLSGEPLWN